MELGNNLYTYCYTDDETYMEDVSDLKQYLLNDVGTIWRGTLNNPTPYFWEYGQVHISIYNIVHHTILIVLFKHSLSQTVWIQLYYC